MKTIGILGGMGPQATIDFVNRIHQVAQQLVLQYANRGYPRLWIAYHREPPMELEEDGSVKEPLKPHPKMLELAKSMGPLVDFIVIPCHTAHFFVREIKDASDRKVLSIVDVTIQEVQRVQMHRRDYPKIGILAVGETLKHRLYQDRLDQLGIPWETIPDDLSAELDESVWKVMEGEDPQNLAAPARKAMQYLLRASKHIYAVILGCTELPLLLGEAYPSYTIDPTQLLAEAAVRYALEK